jgi:hypothetical protein
MTEMLQHVTKEWRDLAHDQPGRRFINHYRRAQQQGSMRMRTLRIALGSVLILCGVALWFLPGPGWLFVIIGLATFAGESRVVARLLDRIEPAVREQVHRLRLWWRGRRRDA